MPNGETFVDCATDVYCQMALEEILNSSADHVENQVAEVLLRA